MKSQLLKKLTRYTATAASLVAIQKTAEGQIVYTDIPDTLVKDGFYFLDLNNDGAFDFRFKKGDWNTTYVSVQGLTYGNSMIGHLTFGSHFMYPAKLDQYDPINSNQPFVNGDNLPYGILAGGTGGDANFDGAINGFLGIRFMIGNDQHYGWIRLNVSQEAEWFIVKDFAYNSVSDVGILAGDKGSAGCTDNFEPNNSNFQATPVVPDVTLQALIGNGTDRDFFGFTIGSGEPHLKVNLSNLPKNYNLRLLDATGQKIAQSANPKKEDEEIIANNLIPGKYVVMVFPKDQSKFDPVNCYTLEIETSNSPFKLIGSGEALSLINISVYPNPISETGTAKFYLESSKHLDLVLRDLNGKQLMQIAEGNFVEGIHEVNFSVVELPKGIYLLQLTTVSGIAVKN